MPDHLTGAEAALDRDLRGLAERTADESFARELYRGLASRRWHCGGTGEVVTPSWTLAERLVNELRERDGREPLALAQTGGEGELSDDVERELAMRGWRSEALNRDGHDDAHATAGGAEPERFTKPGTEWEREAHEAAHGERLRGA